LGQLALEYESQLLGLPHEAVLDEMLRRYDVMAASAHQGLQPDFTGTQLLQPTASLIHRAEAEGRLTVRSAQTRAAIRSMAVMHVDGAMGVVCAAPTGGSAGVIPGALVSLAEERDLSRETLGLALLASGAIGVIVAQRATFAAEIAGCQVEIGAGGAMAAAAIVDAMGGSADEATNAAAIAFQNTMGLVCDPVKGMVEIPCHTRNAVAAANAFVCADLILGGYINPIPLDETIDAVYSVGQMMPRELLCTAQGGLAVTPSALKLVARDCCGNSCRGC
jgi:L-serine dehydratase